MSSIMGCDEICQINSTPAITSMIIQFIIIFCILAIIYYWGNKKDIAPKMRSKMDKDIEFKQALLKPFLSKKEEKQIENFFTKKQRSFLSQNQQRQLKKFNKIRSKMEVKK